MTLTAVCGYWVVHNKHGDKFESWFETTLRVPCPYVFFGTNETIELVKRFRRELPTHYVLLDIKDFYTYRYVDSITTHPVHCPSKELNMIWNEKLFLMGEAVRLNPFGSEYFMWVDAGICSLRGHPSLLMTDSLCNLEILKTLPTDKLIFTSSSSSKFEPARANDTEYYHHVSGTYMIHRKAIDEFILIYKSYLYRCFETKKPHIYTDQIVLTHMYRDNPEFFHKLGHGYGILLHAIRKRNMRITDYKVVYICPDHNEKYNKRKEHMDQLLKRIGFKDIIHFKSSTENYPDCLCKATIDILTTYMEEPFLLLEDDVEFTGNSNLDIVPEADAIYCGLSLSAGDPLHNSHKGTLQYEHYSDTQVRILNMLGGHAVFYASKRYKHAVIDILRANIGEKYYNDVLISRIQSKYLVLANKIPAFYQSARFNKGTHEEEYTKITIL